MDSVLPVNMRAGEKRVAVLTVQTVAQVAYAAGEQVAVEGLTARGDVVRRPSNGWSPRAREYRIDRCIEFRSEFLT